MTPKEIARLAIEEWLEDGMEFAYIYEREDAYNLSEEEQREAHDIALQLIRKIVVPSG